MTKSGSANLKCCFCAKYLRANGSASKCSYIIFLGLSDKKAGTPKLLLVLALSVL